MRRLTAVLLGLALIGGLGHVSALHIHNYTDHDHPEHHHGLAAHDHATGSHTVDGAVHLESCDPSRHTISFLFVCAAPLQAHSVDAEFVIPAISAPEPQLQPSVNVADVRVHGPPSRTQAPPRAPPLIFPA